MTMHHGSSFARSAHQSIKPIETLWKGYRFRSRLEARWAVFFETLGLNWEYEPQGFELPDGSRYLPDFYLPDQKTYVEIKPKTNHEPQRIYLAGKFGSDWRNSIVPDFESMWLESDRWSFPGMEFFHVYAGPYKASPQGHGSEIPCTHGVSGYKEAEGEFFKEGGTSCSGDEVFGSCIAFIDQCDVVFAWIDSLDCYGTLVELGYAKGREKKVVLGISKDLHIPESSFNTHHENECQHDFWFVEKMADLVVYADSAISAYRQTITIPPPELKKISQLDNWLMIAGSPHPGEYQAFRARYGRSIFGRLTLLKECLKPTLGVANYSSAESSVFNALAAARAARFEHGEKP